jgi:hypothetical protein
MEREARYRWWFYLVVPFLVTALTLIAVELALRAVWPIPHGIDRNMYFSPDPYTGYRIKPNSIGSFQKESAHGATSKGTATMRYL